MLYVLQFEVYDIKLHTNTMSSLFIRWNALNLIAKRNICYHKILRIVEN